MFAHAYNTGKVRAQNNKPFAINIVLVKKINYVFVGQFRLGLKLHLRNIDKRPWATIFSKILINTIVRKISRTI